MGAFQKSGSISRTINKNYDVFFVPKSVAFKLAFEIEKVKNVPFLSVFECCENERDASVICQYLQTGLSKSLGI